MQARFVTTITVNDPNFGHPVNLDVYKEDGGMMFATESLYKMMDDPIISPYGNGELTVGDGQ